MCVAIRKEASQQKRVAFTGEGDVLQRRGQDDQHRVSFVVILIFICHSYEYPSRVRNTCKNHRTLPEQVRSSFIRKTWIRCFFLLHILNINLNIRLMCQQSAAQTHQSRLLWIQILETTCQFSWIYKVTTTKVIKSQIHEAFLKTVLMYIIGVNLWTCIHQFVEVSSLKRTYFPPWISDWE